MWTKPIGTGQDSVALRQGRSVNCTWNGTQPPDDMGRRQIEQKNYEKGEKQERRKNEHRLVRRFCLLVLMIGIA
jgi:hypothetical protein